MSGPTDNKRCYIYAGLQDASNAPFLGIVGFEGIPQNFAINVLFWLILHSLFIILRKKAWNYGRMAVVQKEELKWADMFYGDEHDGSADSIHSGHSHAKNATSKTSEHVHVTHVRRESGDTGSYEYDGFDDDINVHRKSTDTDDTYSIDSNEDQNPNEIKDTGYFRWIKITFNLTDKQYHDKCGPDCVYYLSFQRHLIFLAIIVTFFSLAVILPINVHRTVVGEVMVGNTTVKRIGFSDTTIINIGSKYEFLWFHVGLSMIFLFISLVVMRHFSKKLKLTTEEESEHRTVCIIGLNKKNCDENLLRGHIEETYPGTEIVEISFAYDIYKLQTLEFKRLSSTSARIYFQEAFEKNKMLDSTSPRPRMRPYTCGNCKCASCCRCCKDTDAIDYYTECEVDFTKQVIDERSAALQKPVGIVYVTFKNLESAETIVEDYSFSSRLFMNAPKSKFSKELHSNQWIVKYAPEPEDIFWENLSVDYKVWYGKFVIVNIIVVIVAFLFSTPVSIFQSIDFLPTQKSHQGVPQTARRLTWVVFMGILLDTLPALILWIMSVCLIAVVGRSDIMIGFWTKTAGQLSEMIKTFVFLILMIVILPSLGITSFQFFFYKEKNIAWSCIFYKDNGAFFVHYVCTSSLAGTAAELMRLPELFMYAMKLMKAKSGAETAGIRKSLLWDFQIGVSYAWTMLHFAIFVCFSIIYPLVTPFGLLYLLLKHFTDRYNIYFAYAPCKVDREVHTTAVNFVIMSMFLLQLNLLAYVHFHIGDTQYHDYYIGSASDSKIRALQICCLLQFSVTAAFFLGQCCFNMCADLSPFRNRRSHDQSSQVGEEDADAESGEYDDDISRRRSRASHASHGTWDTKFSIETFEGRRFSMGPMTEEEKEMVRTKPYKRYTPAIIRPELLKLALEEAAKENEILNEEVQTVQETPKPDAEKLSPSKLVPVPSPTSKPVPDTLAPHHKPLAVHWSPSDSSAPASAEPPKSQDSKTEVTDETKKVKKKSKGKSKTHKKKPKKPPQPPPPPEKSD